MFVNTVVVLRNHVHHQLTFKELLLQVRQTIIHAVENQNYPIEVLLRKLKMPASGSNFPLTDLAVLLENIQEKKYLQAIPFNLVFSFLKKGDIIEAEVEYSSPYCLQCNTRRERWPAYSARSRSGPVLGLEVGRQETEMRRIARLRSGLDTRGSPASCGPDQARGGYAAGVGQAAFRSGRSRGCEALFGPGAGRVEFPAPLRRRRC